MARFGPYEITRELSAAQGAVVYLASRDGKEYVIKLYTGAREASGDTQTWTRDDASNQTDADRTYRDAEEFAAAVQRQKLASEQEDSCVVPILDAGKDERGAWCAMPFYKDKLKKVIGVHLKPELFYNVVLSLTRAGLQFKARTGAAHGNLRPSNVFISREGDIAQSKALVSDPLPARGRGEAQYEKEDLHAIGEMIYQIVRRREISAHANWPLPAGREWEEWFGKRAETWRDLTNRLLDPNLSPAAYSLEQLEAELKALAPKRALPVPALVGAGVVLLALIGGAIAFFWPKPKPAEMVEILTEPEGAEVWIDYQPTKKPTPFREPRQYNDSTVVKLILPNYVTLETNLSRINRKTIVLRPETGVLRLFSDVNGVQCFDIGANFTNAIGFASPTGTVSALLPVGEPRTIRGVAPGRFLKSVTTNVMVAKSTDRPVTFTFPRGGLTINSSPTGAVVSINRQEVGKTPYVEEMLSPGSYAVSLSLPTYNPATFDVAVLPNKTQPVERTLGRGRGKLRLTLDPPDAFIVWDGKALHPQSNGVLESDFPAGVNSLVMQHPFLKSATNEVVVEQNGTVTRTLSLPYARLEIASNPSEANVLKDGTLVTNTPAVILFDPGAVAYKLEKGELSETVATNLAAGQKASVNVTLTAGFGEMEIVSNLRGAKLFEGDTEISSEAETHFKARVKKGRHELVASYPGLDPVKVTVDVPRDGRATGEAKFVYGAADVSFPAAVAITKVEHISKDGASTALTSLQVTTNGLLRRLTVPIVKPGTLALQYQSRIYEDDVARFPVDAGPVTAFSLASSLKSAKGRLIVWSTSAVQRAEVLLNGTNRLGLLPYTNQLTVGDYRVAVSYLGMTTTNKPVEITKDQDHVVFFDLPTIPERHVARLGNTDLELVWVRGVTNTPNDGCWVGKYEVTREQFARFAGSPVSPAEALLPMVDVPWPKAEEFCNWLMIVDTNKPQGAVYTLPTFAQWDNFAGDRQLSTNSAVIKANRATGAAIVTNGVANQRGLYHTWGNVWEWALMGTNHVIRGASFEDDGLREGINQFRAKTPLSPTNRTEAIGFRVILVPPDTARAQK